MKCRALLATLLTAAACQRELTVPAQSNRPKITGATPTSVFSGYTLALAGTNFDPAPASNVVQFPGFAVPAYGFDPQTKALLVMVPDSLPLGGPDTGTAAFTVTVTNPAGNSGPSPSIIWLGDGRPLLGTVVNNVRIFHRSPGIAATTAGVRIASSLFRAVIGGGASVAVVARPPQKPSALAATSDGRAMLVGMDPGGVISVDPAGAPLVRQTLGGATVRFVFPTGGASATAFAVGNDPSGALQAWAFPANRAATPAQRQLPLLTASGGAAAPDGRTLLVAGIAARGSMMAGVLLLTHPLDPATADVLLDAPVGHTPSGAVAAWNDASGPRAAMALDDGSLAIFDLAAQSLVTTMQAGSSTQVSALLALPGQLVASKPRENSVLSLNAQTGARLWITQLPGQPTALAADPDGTRFHVADDQSDFTDALDLNGKWLGRTSFLVGLGNSPDCFCGAVADYPADPSRSARILVLARALGQLLEIDPNSLALHRGEVLSGSSAPLGLARAPDTTVWVVHQSELGTVNGKSETIVASGLPYPPQRLAFASDGSVLVGSLQDVTVVRADGSVAGGLHLPGPLALLEARGDGKVLVLHSASGSSAGGGLYTIDALVAGGQPSRPLPPIAGVRGFIGAVSQRAGPTLFYTSAPPLGTAAVMLNPDTLLASAPFPSSVKEPGPLGPTPDGLYFLWSRQLSPDAILHVATYYDATSGIADYEAFPLGTRLAIPTFDPSGQYVFTPLPDVDGITVLQ
jgi:DNA-binding beta-propeller fold protein YncE